VTLEAEFVEADRATRLKLVAFVGVLALLILLERLTGPDPAMPGTDPQLAFKQMSDRLLLLTLVTAPFALAWSVYFVRLAIKIRRSGQWPPPGVRVAVRTQIRRGRRATEMWIATLVMAGISLVVFLVILFAWYVASHLVSESALPSARRLVDNRQITEGEEF
jgi:predicted metal-binding membrane protein